MAIFKCKMCGGDLEIDHGQSVGTCEYCGTEQTLPRLDSDRKANLYDRANHFRRNNDFDKAMGIYEQILNEDNTDSEAYWSLVLCRYGIEYVEDPSTNKRIPTINRAQYTSIYADENYKAALEHAEIAQKAVYEQEAKTIDEIQKGILAISEKEEPFDVFICYKESDESGRRTPDSVLANDLYHQLTQEGFKVFFSRITLEDKLGQEYEPYIFAALNSAKVMVVLGTKPNYFNAVWVKNEWSRFLALIRGGAKKMLIPAYKDMDPYDLPEEFSHLQAQDMTKLGFMQDLIRGIKKIIGADQSQTVTKETVVVQQNNGNSNLNALIKRGNMALEDEEWEKADNFFEEVLNQDAECAEAYLGKLMAECEVSDVSSLTEYYILEYEDSETEELEACPEATSHIEDAATRCVVNGYLLESEIRELYEFDRNYTSELSCRNNQKEQQLSELSGEKLFTRAQQYAEGETKNLLDKMMGDITQTLDARISDAEKADSEVIASVTRAYERHINDADSKVKDLYDKALKRQDNSYNSIINQMNQAQTIMDYKKVRDLFGNMHGYKDAVEFAKKCQTEIDRIEEAERLEAERLEAERLKKKKIAAAIVFAAILVGIAVFMVVTKVIIPNQNYNKAVALMNSGQYDESYTILKSLNGYKDSLELMGSIRYEYECEKIKASDIGDLVLFGDYNGNTEWMVLTKKSGKVLVISKNVIETRPYNEEYTSVTWEKCSLRSWLNGEYLTSAFSSGEQSRIIEMPIVNSDNFSYGTASGNNTTDKVFLLSIDEVNEYFSSDSERLATLPDGTPVWWWLRTPGYVGGIAATVNSDGSVDNYGHSVDYLFGKVRPAMWIDISNP